ncbi:MAG: FAD-binding oxidoreductase [Leptolyngbya foveolarum]|uniref:FAD-binding oxidoreductase n=1 Tax=Leptolyngbya foveolarum TaxID=47253 RepID=A0A2W4UL76_9CYAN|nr:MAG: FAD-binding oxidoreductase [Leptolyngbya foveolarum]
MSAIASRLADDLDVTEWDALEADKQARIMAAIGANTPPSCVATPRTEDELSKVMAYSYENGWRVLPMGQGSKLSWGGLAKGIDLVVSTAQLNRLVEHAVGDFTVTVEPGLKVADLQRQLRAQGQFLAVDPAFGELASLGGLVATADTGSLRQRYGGLRDALIGVKFVRYDGAIAKAGGRVVKNVAGYDLMKLMTGSYGSLGILSELTFRLYPVARNLRTVVLSGGGKAIEQAMAEVRMSGLTPESLDVVSATLNHRAGSIGDRVLPQAERSRSLTIVVRFQGVAEGVEEQTAWLKKIATTHGMGCEQMDGAADAEFWAQSQAIIRSDTVLCKVGLRPSGIPWLLELVDDVNLDGYARLHGGNGLGWVQLAQRDELAEGVEKLRSHCQKNGGFLSLLQGPKSLKQSMDVWGYAGDALGVMRDIKDKFDPQRLLSPGRFVGGL